FSYAELEEHANRLAHYLRSLSAGPGTLIGIALNRSERQIFALLGCLKAGAAYVPVDPTYPDERIRHIVDEAEITVLITEQNLVERFARVFTGQVVVLDTDAAKIAEQDAWRLTPADTGLKPDDLCYVIYTSGTTGRPKGVMTEHRNARHFVEAFNEVCITTAEDRVFQGFSLGFDGSVEEIWMAFSNGATLVVGSNDTPRFGNDLARYLAQHGVTYLSTVPTMLTTMTETVPSLRQLVVSGEVCAPELVARWAQAGRRMLNVYGPTEGTVNTTAALCQPGRPITIGRPLRGYETLVLDDARRPVPPGTKGELYVGGAGVARGYLKQPDLTARSFVPSPYDDGGRLYRTGDLVCVNEDGEIDFFGRIDSQVKIRGYRVELSEIENVLLEQASIASAVASLCERDGMPYLAVHVVLAQRSAALDHASLLAKLRERLPAYMVPAYLDVVDALPMLSSGKVDRKRLPPPASPLIDETAADSPPANALERKIADVWAAVFNNPQIGAQQDFFLDLGGHSLLAAQMVSHLRSRAGLHIAVRDVYSFPTIRKLAEHIAAQAPDTTGKSSAPPFIPASVTRAPSFALTLSQLSFILGFGAILSLPLTILVPIVDGILRGRISLADPVTIVLLLLLSPALWPVMIALSIGAKWLIIGRYRPGAYPLWGSYYLRCWLVSRLQALSGAGLFVGTPLMPVYYRLMGAKVGRGCALNTALCSIFDLITIGDNTSIGADTQLACSRVENGHLLIGRIDIGSNCFIGVHSTLGLNVRMGDGSRLDDQSLLPDGEVLASGEQRRGSPAQPMVVDVPEGEPLQFGAPRRVLFTVAALVLSYLSGLFLALPGIGILLIWLKAFWEGWIVRAILVTAAATPLLVVLACLWIALLKAIILRRAKPGVYELYSFYYLRYWLADGLMRASRTALLPLFTTLYLPPWMRLLGAKIGPYAEMSTVWNFTPELLTAGEGSFFADGCMLGAKRMHSGRWEIRANRIGRRSFIGNSAILPTGASVGDNCLLGVLSAPPSRTEPVPDGSDWLGSPAFRLPNRQKVGGFNDSQTFRPTRKLYLHRAVIDALRILIPTFTGFVLGLAGLVAALATYEAYGVWITFAITPFLGLTLAAIAVALVVAIKWVVMGKFKPVIVPLWCPYVWCNEMINGAYESIMAPVVATFLGTPFAAPLLRLLGCRIGRHCYIATTLFSEFDLVEIGNHVALNSGVVIQNHLFEDRIMKSSYLAIDDGCTVGNMSVVLYDTHMEHDAVLGPLSLLMKGEIMPAGSRWHGIPTVAGRSAHEINSTAAGARTASTGDLEAGISQARKKANREEPSGRVA
ncbi:MAG: Pls/PosA family non-ribosomal peptide synthetase, partial [Candidatus Korobacteraceae bacterium]